MTKWKHLPITYYVSTYIRIIFVIWVYTIWILITFLWQWNKLRGGDSQLILIYSKTRYYLGLNYLFSYTYMYCICVTMSHVRTAHPLLLYETITSVMYTLLYICSATVGGIINQKFQISKIRTTLVPTIHLTFKCTFMCYTYIIFRFLF